MKLDKVFIAFLKDDKEHLLFKKSDNLYIDLNTKEKYTKSDIDLNTLRCFKDVIYCMGEHKNKNSIKKIYNKDRKELMDTSELCIAKIRQVSELNKEYLGNSVNLYEWKAIYLYKTILRKNCPGSYSDLENRKLFLEPNTVLFENGYKYVDEKTEGEIIPLSKKIGYYGSIEKIKVLNLNYKLFKSK